MTTLRTILLLTCVALSSARAAAQRAPAASTEPAHTGQVTTLFRVGDLLPAFGREFPAPRIGDSMPWRAPVRAEMLERRQARSEPSEAEREAQAAAGARNLAALLRRHVQPQLVESLERIECEAGGTLIVCGTSEQLAWVGACLERLRSFASNIAIDTRIVEGPPTVLAELGLEDHAVLARPEDLAALDSAVQATRACNLLSTPRLVTLPAQRASLSTLDEFKFVADGTVERVEPGAREVVVPELRVIHEGLALDVRALPLEGDLFALEIDLQHARVTRPVRTQKLELAGGAHELEIAMPECQTERFEATLLVRSGSSVVIRAPSLDPQKSLALVVTARTVSREAR